MRVGRAIGALLIAGTLMGAAEAPKGVPDSFFRLRAATKLIGKSPEWDYLAYDPARGLLMIGRRNEGLTVFDTRTRAVRTRVAQTEGAGAVLLIPGIRRGFTTNEDGSTTVFDLTSFAPIRRVKFADDADSGVYDAVTGQIAFMSGDSKHITFINAKSLATTGKLAMQSTKLEGAAADGVGGLYLAERDRNMLAHIDMRTRRVLHEWPTTRCVQPTGLAMDKARRRVMLGCRGTAPVLAVMDMDDGHVVQTLPLGRGNDGLVFNQGRVFATNGVEANLTIYRQIDADHYRLEQAVATRPGARTLALDMAGERVFTVTAEGVVDPAKPINRGPSEFYPNAFLDDSFVVLEYGARKAQ